MPRLLFEKTGNAVWISHLDLMRLFQRAFKRAGLPLTHTQGYNPRPSVSIALPLSVGVQSRCELLDFDLDGTQTSDEDILMRLNTVLVDGVRVRQAYSDGRKIRDLALLRSVITLEYDLGIPENAEQRLRELFAKTTLIVPKKSKNGIQDQDIIPMIRDLSIIRCDNRQLQISVLACCQNPALNPMQLVSAVNLYEPDLIPDFTTCCRMEIYDSLETVFR